MTLHLVVGWDAAVARWVGDQLDIDDFGPNRAIGIADDGDLIAGFVFNNYRPPGIEITLASTSPRWCTPRLARGVLSYPFGQLGCRRITAIVSASNAHTQLILQRCGYHREGVLRKGRPNGEDAIIYGLLREEMPARLVMPPVSRRIEDVPKNVSSQAA